MSFKEFFLLMSFVQSILLAIALFSLPKNRLANGFLAFYVLLFGVDCYYRYTVFQDYNYILSHHWMLRGNWVISMMLYIPFFLYIKYMCNGKNKFDKRDFLHFIPATIVFILWINFFILSGEDKMNLLTTDSLYKKYDSIMCMIVDYCVLIQGAIYIVFIYRYIARYHRKIEDKFSNIDNLRMNWLRNIISLIFATIVIATIGVQAEFWDRKLDDYIINSLYYLVGFTIYVISYYLLAKRELFVTEIDSDFSNDNVVCVDINYTSEGEKEEKVVSQLDPQYCDEVIEKLQKAMFIDKMYLEQSLNLDELAKKIGIPRHHISMILNKNLNNTFFDYINKFRIEEAKKKIQDPESNNYTLLAIAYDSGFNSKATFNRSFIKYENMTPFEYKKNVSHL